MTAPVASRPLAPPNDVSPPVNLRLQKLRPLPVDLPQTSSSPTSCSTIPSPIGSIIETLSILATRFFSSPSWFTQLHSLPPGHSQMQLPLTSVQQESDQPQTSSAPPENPIVMCAKLSLLNP